MPSTCQLQSPHPHHICPLSHKEPGCPCPNLHRARYRTTGDTPCSQGLLKLLKLVNPKPAYPALPIPSHRNHNKGSCPHFLPSLPQPPDRPWCSPMWLCLVWHAPSSWGLWQQTTCSVQLTPDLSASPCLNNTKTCILKYHFHKVQDNLEILILSMSLEKNVTIDLIANMMCSLILQHLWWAKHPTVWFGEYSNLRQSLVFLISSPLRGIRYEHNINNSDLGTHCNRCNY